MSEEAFDESGYRCCCDKRKGWKDSVRGSTHAGYCKVVRTDRCGSVKVTPETAVAHEFQDTDGKCEIMDTDVKAFYEEYRSKSDYCQAGNFSSHMGQVAAPAMAFGEGMAYPCGAGWEAMDATEGKLKCDYATPQAGKLVAEVTPKCIKIIDYCRKISQDWKPGKPTVASAVVGNTNLVTCSSGFRPVSKIVTCTAEGVFYPTPECVPQQD